MAPKKVFWKSTSDEALIKNEEHLLIRPIGQALLTSQQDFLVMKSNEEEKPGILLDFGINLHGGIQLVTGMTASKEPVKVRIRFGESVTEAMSDIDTLFGATNDHAIMDMVIPLPWLGKIEGNKENLDGTRFLDWPSSENPEAIHAGLQAMLIWAFDAAGEIFGELGEEEMKKLCMENSENLRTYHPDPNRSKQAASLMALTGIMDPKKANQEIISVGGVRDFSTFYGYYMLESKAKAGDYLGAIDNIRTYWGAMIDLGATTFWEDFSIDWLENAGRIDEFVSPDKVDVHATYGGYSYDKLRHNLSHGWASGPTAWMSRHILGIEVLEPGTKKVRIQPHLGDLEWAEGTYPTPYGQLSVRHERQVDGSVKSVVDEPDEVEVILEK